MPFSSEAWRADLKLGEFKVGWSTIVPAEPGVYVIKTGWKIGRLLGGDSAGILYVGMSANIQNRV